MRRRGRELEEETARGGRSISNKTHMYAILSSGHHFLVKECKHVTADLRHSSSRRPYVFEAVVE